MTALVAVEPTARSVQRDARRLAEQATELHRLALVAEHTSALVAISDRENKALWVNEAFVTLTGFSLEEVRGRRPRDVLLRPREFPISGTTWRTVCSRGLVWNTTQDRRSSLSPGR